MFFENSEFSLSIANNKDLATELAAGYISVMTWESMAGVRRLRIEDIDLRARRVNLGSNDVTALSSSGKLLLISEYDLY